MCHWLDKTTSALDLNKQCKTCFPCSATPRLLLLGSDIVIANGDKLGIDEFAIHCDHNQQLWVVQLEEILVKARNSPQVWVGLVQIYQAQGLVAPYQMPKLVSSGYHAVVTAAVSIIHQ